MSLLDKTKTLQQQYRAYKVSVKNKVNCSTCTFGKTSCIGAGSLVTICSHPKFDYMKWLKPVTENGKTNYLHTAPNDNYDCQWFEKKGLVRIKWRTIFKKVWDFLKEPNNNPVGG